MNSILGFGKYLYALPIAAFGLGHFANAGGMAGMVPVPGGAVWVYITGVALVAAAVSIFIGKYDKLGTALLALLLLIFAFSIHLPNMMGSDPGLQQMGMGNFMKDVSLAGAAMMYSHSLSKDKAIIG